MNNHISSESKGEFRVKARAINVLIVNPFSVATSGNDEVLLRVLEKIDCETFRFTIVQPGDSPYVEKYRKLGATVLFTRMSVIKRNLNVSFVIDYAIDFFPTIWRIAKLCRKLKIDIVHTNTTQILGGGAAARILGIPGIYHAHSIISDPWWVVKLMSFWMRLTADYMFSNSRASAASFMQNKFPSEKVGVIGNPVTVELFEGNLQKGSFRKEIGVNANTPLVGIAGRVTPNKKIEQFLEAAKIVSADLPEAEFIVIGGANSREDEEYLDRMKRLAVELGIANKVRFTGRRSDIPTVMGDLDVLAHAHTYEAFGLVLAEAMTAKVPVAAPDSGGIPDLVEHGVTGYLSRPDDPASLAKNIIALIKDPINAKKMGEAGAAKIDRQYRAELVADSIAQVYLRLLKNKSK